MTKESTKRGDKKVLRLINGKVKPAYNEEDLDHRPDEIGDGITGKGPLVRKYLDNLDMEFVAFRAKEKRDQDMEKVSLRVPASVLNDLSVFIQSGKLPFTTNSQFIRTATLILMNYWGQKFPYLKKRMTIRHGIDLCQFESDMKRLIEGYVGKFEKILPQLNHKSDQEIDRFLKEHLKILDDIWDEKIRRELVKKFSEILEANGIDPTPYFGEEKEEA